MYRNRLGISRRFSFHSLLRSCIIILVLLLTTANAFPVSSKAWDIKFFGSISETYDDNLTYAKGDKKEDFITTIGVGVNITRQGKKRSLSINGNIDQRFNARFSDIKTSSQNLNIVINQDLSKYSSMRLSDNFSHSRFPSNFEEEFGRVAGQRETYENAINLNYINEFSERIKLHTYYSFDQTFFPDDDVIDTSKHSLRFNLGYRYGIASTFSLTSSYAKNNFGNSIYSAGLGIKQQVYITKKSFITGNAGLKGNSSDNIGLNINLEFATEINERTILSFKFNTSDQLTDEGGEIFDNWRISTNLSRDLHEKLDGSIAVNYAKGTFSSTDITDTLLGIDTLFGYFITESLSGRMRYSYSNLDSTNTLREYAKNVLTVHFTKTF